ncbi:MAG: phage baseplate plug protein [Anaerotignaceae bacterium]
MIRDRIEVKKNLIPYSFNITLAGEVFELGINYNEYADLFTLNLTKDSELICAGEPIVYGVPLFNDIYVNGKYPNIIIIPHDDSGENTTVTWDNFQETVFLVIDNGSDAIE